MSTIHQVSAEEIEQQRQKILKEMVSEHGSNWTEDYAPGTHGFHELLDRTSIAAITVEEFILSHPACAQNAEWFELAVHAVDALNELYQRVGAEHLSASDKVTGEAPR
jgi:hypothetical protein